MIPNNKIDEAEVSLKEYGIDILLNSINTALNLKGLTLTYDLNYNLNIYFVTLLGTECDWFNNHIEGDNCFYLHNFDYSPTKHFYNILQFEINYLDDNSYNFNFNKSPYH